MENENCEGHDAHPFFMIVPKVALLATVMGIGACARHRRHRQLELEGGCAEHDGHCGCQPSRHRGPGQRGHRFDGPGHGPQERDVHFAGPEHAPAKPKAGPLEILETRFANGEIDEDEFRRRRGVLQENAH